jgi:hypothetical protein
MPNTVDLSNLNVDPSKQLSLVSSGLMSMSDYLKGLTAQGVSGSWISPYQYVIDFGPKGFRDPFGSALTTPEQEQVVKALMPSPLRSAGKEILLRGPMPKWVSGLVARVCYAAEVRVEVVDRVGGKKLQVSLAKLERDQVRLVRPDTLEQEVEEGKGRVYVKTRQLSYRRPSDGPKFDYYGALNLVMLELRDPLHPRPRAQVQDVVNALPSEQV